MTEVAVDWMQAQRWFAGAAADVVEADAAVAGAVTTSVARRVGVTVASIGSERYQLLTLDGHHDAVDDPAVATALLEAMAADSIAFGPAGTVTFHRFGGQAIPTGDARSIEGEQSNSSVVIGDAAVLKILRRLRPGTHPEKEMLAELGARNCRHVPALLGWYEVIGGPVDATLGLLTEFVPGALDGWRLILDRLRHDPPSTIPLLHELGITLAEIHADLAAASADPAFAPVDGGRELSNRVGRSLFAEARHLSASQPSLGDLLERAVSAASLLADRLDAGPAIRHHGDLHLGQTLRGADRWVVIDWEGEPGRPLEERRAKQSPLADVAGMLRSFAYARATHERTLGRPCPGWEQAARAAFLDGYLAHAAPGLLPASAVATKRLLRLFELRKVVYEIGYEAAHRPDWVDIPVDGLRRLLDGVDR